MDDAPVARRHRLEAKRFTSLAHALGGHFGGEPQFGDARGAKVTTIETHPVVELRFEPQPANGNVLEGLEQISVALQQERLVRSIKIDRDFGGFQILGLERRCDVHSIVQVETRTSQDSIEASANFRGGGLTVESAITNKTGGHG